MPVNKASCESNPLDWLEEGPARDLYRHLVSIKEIDRLRRMPQLGAVEWVDPNVKHTRYDYMVQIMEFAQVITSIDEVLGPWGKVTIGDHQIDHGRDVLQCWAMLSNYGHLWGTFATERVVLDAVRSPGGAQKHFLQAMERVSDEQKTFAERVVNDYCVYDLHLAIAVGLLYELPENRNARDRRLWWDLLSRYPNSRASDGASGDEKVGLLRRVYRIIRQLAYLSLDLTRAHLPISMGADTLKSKLSTYVRELLATDEGPLHRLVRSLNDYIRREIYLSPDVVLAHRLLDEQAAESDALTCLSRATSSHHVFSALQKMKSQEAWTNVVSRIRAEQSGYPYRFRLQRERRQEGPPASWAEQDAFAAKVPRLHGKLSRIGERCLGHVAAGMGYGELFVDFFVPWNADTRELGATLRALCSQACHLETNPGRSEGPEVRSWLATLLQPILPRRGSTALRIQQKAAPGISADESFVLVSRDSQNAGRPREKLKAAIDWLQERLKNVQHGTQEQIDLDSRRVEMLVLRDSLERHRDWDYRLVFLGGFKVVERSPKSDSRHDFDGAYVDVQRNRVLLRLVEAKARDDPDQASREAETDLADKLRDLDWNRFQDGPVARLQYDAEATIVVSYENVYDGRPAQ